MYVHPRKDRQGNIYYSFSYVNDAGKRVRLKKSEHPHHNTLDEAQTWAASQAATYASRKADHLRKLSWRNQYYEFDELLAKYATWQEKQAPNTWKSCVGYLNNWIFPYFLQERQMGNVNDWHLAFREFRDWLQAPEALVKRNRKTALAVSTVNNIIKTLNTFISCLVEYNLMDPDHAKKAKALPEHLTNRRSYEDVIPEEELRAVEAVMRGIHPPAADFFLVLWHTGMRFSELFGLPITALFKGPVGNKPLQDELTKCGITYLGYLYLDSQPVHDDRKREENRSLARKPLKSRKEISPKHARIVPIRSKEVWNILATRFKAQTEAFLKKTYTANKADYVFFEDLEWNKAVNTLAAAYEHLNRKRKHFHDCRHSFVTLLVGETRSPFLVRMITGHKKDASFERYLHIYEQIAMQAKQNDQDIDVV